LKTYGKLRYSVQAKAWGVADASPHVAMAFKRLFPRIPQEATVFVLSDTDEVRADLEWFMQRYPFEHQEHERIAEGANRIRRRLEERDKILLPDWKPGEVPGFLPGKQPYVYQSQAARIAVNNEGMLCGDDVGLGKTITALAALTMGAPLPAGIVVQPHLATQWQKRIREFTSLSCHIIKGRTPYSLPAAEVYIFKYSNILGWVDFLKDGFLRSVAFDEIQELRHGGNTSKGVACAIAADAAQFRMGLTATPIYNYGDEMHAIMNYVRPGLLGERHEFIREWCGMGRIVNDPDGLGSYLRDTGYFLRRDENDPAVDRSMPPPNVIDWEVAWDDDAAADEEAVMRMLAQTVLRGDFAESGRAARELDIKMRQITGLAKARSVAAYVKLLLRDHERVLLAGWHREVYGIWQKALAQFNPVLYTGSETTAGKDRSAEAFIKGKARVMFISLRSGIGLDGLQHNCNQVVFGELDWSPQVHHQIIGRVRRPGQRLQVDAHYLHTDGGSDPVLMETLGVKADQSRGINDPGQQQAARFTDDSRIKRLAQYVLDGRA
jgi:SNF2 family DNA or RNA helicase